MLCFIESGNGREIPMSKSDKPVAKSLHTITVLVQVARFVRENCAYSTAERRNNPTNEAALAEAMETLGLAGRADPYGLAALALKQL